jgi:4-aminobutyrate aminotransferase
MGEPGFGEHVQKMGEYLREQLRKLQDNHPLIGDVRGKGLMTGIELVRNKKTKEPAQKERNSILISAFEEGLTLLPAGESVIRFCPPLILESGDINLGMEILDRVMNSHGY